jgi:molecular chaperone Hsp33
VRCRVYLGDAAALGISALAPDGQARSRAEIGRLAAALPAAQTADRGAFRLALPEPVSPGPDGRCAITLDPQDRLPGQQPYQGVVPLVGDHGENLERLSEVIEHYMLQSEQLDTRLVLAANDQVAAGLLIQRLPMQGQANLGGGVQRGDEDHIGQSEDYNRISILASSLKREELLTLDAETILRRLFWEEDVVRFDPLTGEEGPRFRCSCSRERVSAMLRSLGTDEVGSILAEQGQIDVTCEFCGQPQRFDPVDAAHLFLDVQRQMPGSETAQ